MKRRWVIWGIPTGLVLAFLVATGTKVIAAGGSAELAKILDAAAEGLRAYFEFLLEVLKTVW